MNTALEIDEIYRKYERREAEYSNNPEALQNLQRSRLAELARTLLEGSGEWFGEGSVQDRGGLRVSFTRRFDSLESAKAEAARFPKSARVQADTCYATSKHFCNLRVDTCPDQRTGAVNEAAQKRLKSFLKLVPAPRWNSAFNVTNAATFEQVLSAINNQ
jgi:hypothetical protein